MVEPRGDGLAEKLAAIRLRHPTPDPEMVADVVRAVLSTLSGDLSAQETSLLSEVEELGRTISSAKAEIAALRVDDITLDHIPFATDELDAIVEHTATATNAILNSCETLDAVAGTLSGEPAAKLQDATTQIYEACSFQDITGQRITKVWRQWRRQADRSSGGRRTDRGGAAERTAASDGCDGSVGYR
jgi:chemotaxis protein CheZ